MPQIGQFTAMIQELHSLKKGDRLEIDWIPNSGTRFSLNGKPLGDVAPDIAFQNAMLRIWIGDRPVESSLKVALLGSGGR